MIDIENVVPAFTEDERNIFFKMLNDQLGGTLKKDYLAEVNSFYVATLNKHLNDEALLSTSNFTYTYKGINLTYGNLVKTFQLSNDTTKGLEAYMLFGLESST